MTTTAKTNSEKPLTKRQAVFVQEFLIDLNATQAAIRSGYEGKRVAETGWELLHTPKVAAAIKSAQAKLAARAEATQDWVVGQLKIMALKPSVKDADRIRCLELIGKHIGMFNTLTIEGNPDKPVTVQDVSDLDAARKIAFVLAKAVHDGSAKALDPAFQAETQH